MSLKDIWVSQDTTMDASPDIPNMLADAIIQNETDITNLQGSVETAQSTAESANQTAVTVSRQLDDMNVAIQGHTNDILNTNITVSQLTERVAQNETDIKELQDNGGSGEAEIIYVTLTQSEGGAFYADMTYEEMGAAFDSGKQVVVRYHDGFANPLCYPIYSNGHGFAVNIEFASPALSNGILYCISCLMDDTWIVKEINLATNDEVNSLISADNPDFVAAVIASLPDADTMSFPLEETTSEVSEDE